MRLDCATGRLRYEKHSADSRKPEDRCITPIMHTDEMCFKSQSQANRTITHCTPILITIENPLEREKNRRDVVQLTMINCTTGERVPTLCRLQTTVIDLGPEVRHVIDVLKIEDKDICYYEN